MLSNKNTPILRLLIGMTLAFTASLSLFAQAASTTIPTTTPPNVQAPSSAPHHTTQSDPLAELGIEERALYDAGMDARKQGREADFYAAFKKLLPKVNQGTHLGSYIADYFAETALNLGQKDEACEVLTPLAAKDPANWRTQALMARCYAEKGDKAARDKQIAKLIAMHDSTTDEQFKGLKTFQLERVSLKNGQPGSYLSFQYAFAPYGNFKTYLNAIAYDAQQQYLYRVAVESSDMDQTFFKNPKEGERRFSLDRYSQREEGGKRVMMHALMGFYDEVYSYDVMRGRIIEMLDTKKEKSAMATTEVRK
jgi:hypothetical protein